MAVAESETKRNGEGILADTLLNNPEYKISQFNMLFENNDMLFLYNTMRGTFLEISPKKTTDYLWLGDDKSHISKKQEQDQTNFHNNWFHLDAGAREKLILGGFVVPLIIDEFGLLAFNNKLERYRRDYCSLTVALTYACNMNCSYCYENAPIKRGKMSSAVASQLIGYVEKIIKDGCKVLDITWYGGEPLLQYDLIQELSKKLIALCAKKDVKYGASIITNGTLLTAEKARILKRYKVDFAQITLDGPAAVHDLRRPLKSGPSFECILNNIVDVCEIIRVSIRCNVDKSNVNSVVGLVDILEEKGLSGKVSMNFAPVSAGPTNEKLQNCKTCPRVCGFYNYRSFSKIQLELQDYAVKKGFSNPALPHQKTNACMADRIGGFVVEPNGKLSKCWECIGKGDEAVGDLENGMRLTQKTLRWLNYDPFKIRRCCNCKMLPLCMGWCPIRVMSLKSEMSCQTIKYNLVGQLMRYWKHNSSHATSHQKG